MLAPRGEPEPDAVCARCAAAPGVRRHRDTCYCLPCWVEVQREERAAERRRTATLALAILATASTMALVTSRLAYLDRTAWPAAALALVLAFVALAAYPPRP